MSNVLPPEARLTMMRRARARFVLVGALVLLSCAVVALLSLLPAFVSISVARSSLSEESSEERTAREDQTAIARAQTLVQVLNPLAGATTSPVAVLNEVLTRRPAGLSVTSITYTGGSTDTFLLSGTSARRDAVGTYRDALRASGKFNEVAVPVGALVGAQDGRFSITLSGSF